MFNNPIFESAFKLLDILFEEDFNLNSSTAEEINDFIDEDDSDDVVDVIDIDAEDEDDLDDSNVGKIILQCPCCETVICKNRDEIELPDDEDENEDLLVQIGDLCPVCFSEEGYKIIGQVAPYEEIEVEVSPKDSDVDTDTDADSEFDNSEVEDDDLEESFEHDLKNESGYDKVVKPSTDKSGYEQFSDNRGFNAGQIYEESLNEDDQSADDKMIELINKNESLHEGLNDIQLETDHDTISIHAELKTENGEEMIAPLDFQAANEIVDSQDSDEADSEYLDDIDVGEENGLGDNEFDTSDEFNTDDLSLEEESPETDEDIEDFDTESFDDLGESYLRNVYDNVKSYMTESVKEKGDGLLIEGTITFKNGHEHKTQFMIEGDALQRSTGKCNLLAENLQITPGVKAFNILGRLKNGKLISEQLNYRYNQDNIIVKGTINR